MFLLAAAAIAASTPPLPPAQGARATVQARATVRIMSGVRLRLGEQPSGEAPAARETLVRTDGTVRRAKLIEFE